MLEENKNLKDTSFRPSSESTSLVPSWDNSSSSYTKTNKLITALYMVTDIMDKEEPIRIKLRTLGIEILSDITSLSKGTATNLEEKITSILSFLNIAFDLRMISEMNCNILIKEFGQLKQSIQEFTNQKHQWLEEFISQPSSLLEESKNYSQENKISSFMSDRKNGVSSKGQSSSNQGTRIGVQKGGTLMDALHKVKDKKDFIELRNKRRDEIVSVIKDKPNGMSIKDIIIAVRGMGEGMGEKTLQRELIAMVKDNILHKKGDKRWSQYFLN